MQVSSHLKSTDTIVFRGTQFELTDKILELLQAKVWALLNFCQEAGLDVIRNNVVDIDKTSFASGKTPSSNSNEGLSHIEWCRAFLKSFKNLYKEEADLNKQ